MFRQALIFQYRTGEGARKLRWAQLNLGRIIEWGIRNGGNGTLSEKNYIEFLKKLKNYCQEIGLFNKF